MGSKKDIENKISENKIVKNSLQKEKAEIDVIKSKENELINELNNNIKQANKFSEDQLQKEMEELNRKYNKDVLEKLIDNLTKKISDVDEVLIIQNKNLQTNQTKLEKYSSDSLEKEIRENLDILTKEY